jgi:hypothetical protein
MNPGAGKLALKSLFSDRLRETAHGKTQTYMFSGNSESIYRVMKELKLSLILIPYNSNENLGS